MCSASPAAFSTVASSPYFIPAENVTVSPSKLTSAGSASSVRCVSASPIPVNEWREPSTWIESAPATSRRSWSSVRGTTSARAAYS